MVEFRRIQMTLFVILLLQFAAVTGQPSTLTTRAGDEVTLPCYNVIKDQDRCDATSWRSSRYSERTTAELITLGQINENRISKATSDRLSVAADCSLVIRNVIEEDAGLYACRQYRSGQQQGGDASILLSVVNVTEHTVNGTVFFFCWVSTDSGCRHTVEWLYGGKNTHVEIFPSSCSARVGFSTQSKIEGLRCNVTDTRSGKTLLYHVAPPTKTGEEVTTVTEIEHIANATTPYPQAEPSVSGWLRFIVVSVGLAALIISVVAVNVRARMKEQKTQTEEIAVRYDGEDETVNYENIGPPDEVQPRHTC